MNPLQALLERVRHVAAVAGVAAFALVQGVSPLLHAHVVPSVADSQVGIHLPVAVVHEGHGHTSATLSVGVPLEESSAITAPTEHRRNEAAIGHPPVGAAAAPIPPTAQACLVPRARADRVATAGGRHLRPPAQGPPANV